MSYDWGSCVPDSQRSEISHQRKEEEELIVIDRGSEIDINIDPIDIHQEMWLNVTEMFVADTDGEIDVDVDGVIDGEEYEYEVLLRLRYVR